LNWIFFLDAALFVFSGNPVAGKWYRIRTPNSSPLSGLNAVLRENYLIRIRILW
jgi:hypothetical protein